MDIFSYVCVYVRTRMIMEVTRVRPNGWMNERTGGRAIKRACVHACQANSYWKSVFTYTRARPREHCTMYQRITGAPIFLYHFSIFIVVFVVILPTLKYDPLKNWWYFIDTKHICCLFSLLSSNIKSCSQWSRLRDIYNK